MTLDELITALVELRENLSGHIEVVFVDEIGGHLVGEVSVGNGDTDAEVWLEEG